MSLLGRLFRTTSPPAASKTVVRAGMACEEPGLKRRKCSTGYDRQRRRFSNHGKARSDGDHKQSSWEDVFIRSLVRASLCPKHAYTVQDPLLFCRALSISTYHRTKRRLDQARTRQFSSHARANKASALAAEMPEEISRKEYKDLVDIYDSPSDMWEKLEHKQPHFRLAPRLVSPPEEETTPRLPEPAESPDHRKQIRDLYVMIQDQLTPHTKLWKAYLELPTPRPTYLWDEALRGLFRHLSVTEFKDTPEAMQRYMMLIDECCANNVAVMTEEWNSAIAFAGKWLRKVSETEVKAAVETWMRMEQSGSQADNVTYNILFDVAVKAGKFALAETILNELKARNMELNRYLRVGLIYYQGLRGSGESVRQVFRDLVNAGEIVDTAVMNCVITSLLRAGEAPAAEHVFAKMKCLHLDKLGTKGPESWREQREMGVLLHRTGKRLRKEKVNHEVSFFGGADPVNERREAVQKASPIAPNLNTYRILIKHHAIKSMDLFRIEELLQEMSIEGIHLHGNIYFHIFRGFVLHGGFTFSSWSKSSLEGHWLNFLRIVDEPPPNLRKAPLPNKYRNVFKEDDEGVQVSDSDSEGDGGVESDSEISAEEMSDTDSGYGDIAEEERAPYFSVVLTCVVLHAFHKCGGRQRALEIWDVIKRRWKPDQRDEDAVGTYIAKLMPRHELGLAEE